MVETYILSGLQDPYPISKTIESWKGHCYMPQSPSALRDEQPYLYWQITARVFNPPVETRGSLPSHAESVNLHTIKPYQSGKGFPSSNGKVYETTQISGYSIFMKGSPLAWMKGRFSSYLTSCWRNQQLSVLQRNLSF